MFTDKELEATVDFIKRKRRDILDSKKGPDLDYLRNLQTLAKLEDAANRKIVDIERDKCDT